MIDRLRAVPALDAAAAAGLGLALAGMAVVADALVVAAPSSDLGRLDRLTYGLWLVRLEHGLTFTAGLALGAWALARGATLGGWSGTAARLGAGLAYGLAVLAAAVVVASTYVALRGHVGSGLGEVQLSDRDRVFTWLRQLATAVGFGGVWLLAAVRLGRLAEASPARLDAPVAEVPAVDAAAPETATLGAVDMPRPPAAPGPPAPVPATPSSPLRAAPVAPPATAPGAAEAGVTLSARARDVYRQRLAYSPRGTAAQALVQAVVQAEAAARIDEAERLLAQLEAL